MSPLDCPRCGSNDAFPRELPGTHDRGPITVFCCSLCGEQIGPILAESDPASSSSDPVRHAAKPANVVSSVSRHAAKPRETVCAAVQPVAAFVSNLSACVAAVRSMSFDLMEAVRRAEIFSAHFAKKLRGPAYE